MVWCVRDARGVFARFLPGGYNYCGRRDPTFLHGASSVDGRRPIVEDAVRPTSVGGTYGVPDLDFEWSFVIRYRLLSVDHLWMTEKVVFSPSHSPSICPYPNVSVGES
jgi:hypothetical protein